MRCEGSGTARKQTRRPSFPFRHSSPSGRRHFRGRAPIRPSPAREDYWLALAAFNGAAWGAVIELARWDLGGAAIFAVLAACAFRCAWGRA